jgi:hypothetical protein
MTKAEIMPLFLCLIVFTWLLYIPAFAIALSQRGFWRQVVPVMVLCVSAAALAVVTLDTIRAGVWRAW